MACCTDNALCGMHESESDAGATRVVSQAEADRCCAASEQDDSAPSQTSFGQSITPPLVLTSVSVLLPQRQAHADIWRASVPLPTAHVPKHLLLSVFLV
jgi:hypothetical protein